MRTILPIGTTVCQRCRLPIAVVRRTIEQPCDVCDLCDVPHLGHTHTVPDVAWMVVDAEGERHRCAE